jgi:hypothetical protein
MTKLWFTRAWIAYVNFITPKYYPDDLFLET